MAAAQSMAPVDTLSTRARWRTCLTAVTLSEICLYSYIFTQFLCEMRHLKVLRWKHQQQPVQVRGRHGSHGSQYYTWAVRNIVHAVSITPSIIPSSIAC